MTPPSWAQLQGSAVAKDLSVYQGISKTRTSGDEVDGLVDTAEGRDIDGLAADNTSSSDASGILTRARVLDGLDEDLEGVLVSHEGDEVESMADDAEGEDLLSGVAAVHHESVDEALDDGAGGLAETLGEATSSVGEVDGPLTSADVVLLAEHSREDGNKVACTSELYFLTHGSISISQMSLQGWTSR